MRKEESPWSNLALNLGFERQYLFSMFFRKEIVVFLFLGLGCLGYMQD